MEGYERYDRNKKPKYSRLPNMDDLNAASDLIEYIDYAIEAEKDQAKKEGFKKIQLQIREAYFSITSSWCYQFHYNCPNRDN